MPSRTLSYRPAPQEGRTVTRIEDRREGSVGSAAPEIGLDGESRRAEAGAVDLQVLHQALDVVARLGEGDELNPIDHVDLGVARVAMGLDPVEDAAAAGIIGREGHHIGAAEAVEELAEMLGAEGGVVGGV